MNPVGGANVRWGMRWLRTVVDDALGRSRYRRPDEMPVVPRHRRAMWWLVMVACVASVAMFVFSAFSVKIGSWRSMVQIGAGKAVVWWSPGATTPPGTTVYELTTGWPPIEWPRVTVAGKVVTPGTAWSAPLWYASVPLWWIAGGLWLGVAVLVVLRLPWGYCRRCGYNLRVVSPLRPCPECGGENTRS